MRINVLSQKFVSVMLTAVLSFSVICFSPDSKTNADSGREGNIGANNYSYFTGSPHPYSYMVTTTDGGYMIFEGNRKDASGYLVQYYNSSLSLKSSKTVPVELPLFGCFYSDGSNYYVLSGQQNPNESDDVECFRLTKYDLSWNRLSSLAIKACLCYCPFAAGSASIDSNGTSLVIRTCCTRYKMWFDGLHHQSNKTFLVDKSSMKLLVTSDDEYTDFGFVSHSFNQFVKFDGEKIVGVDHGDANPRAVVLNICEKDVNYWGAEFYKETRYKVLDIFDAGNLNNNTDASVGGFEMSDSSYIVAGSSADQSGNSDSKTYNIFVSTVSRSSDGSVGLKWLTNYGKDDESVTTPHLVKINNNRFAVLWTHKAMLYYAFVDGKGNLTGSVYSAVGLLSDCKPVVSNGKLVWYACDNGYTHFYTIDTSSGAFTSTNNPIPISAAYVNVKNVLYTGGNSRDIRAEVTVMFGGKKLVEGTDYTLYFDNYPESSYGFVEISGKGNYYGEVFEEYWILKGKGWGYDGWQWFYFDEQGNMLKGWFKDRNTWYYLNLYQGFMYTGFRVVKDKTYYFGSNGAMRTGWNLIDGYWYYFNSDGEMLRQWQTINGKRYYLGYDGCMCTGWRQIWEADVYWYYFGSSGEAATGWREINGKWYYFDPAGIMLTGWRLSGGKWYYLDPSSGSMVTGWKQIDGKWYYFLSSGEMKTGWHQSGGSWYYFEPSGAMVTGSREIGGKTYTFNSSGVCTNP